MKAFLNAFMRDNKQGQLNKDLQPVFVNTTQAIRTGLGPKPFHVRAGLSTPVFDAVYVAFARNTGAIPTDIKARYQRLLADDEFQTWTQRATTDVDAVKRRIELASEFLFG
jgi:hypothetical protein